MYKSIIRSINKTTDSKKRPNPNGVLTVRAITIPIAYATPIWKTAIGVSLSLNGNVGGKDSR